MTIPTLETERLRLVPPSLAADELYQRFYTDAEASAFYNGPLSPQAAWTRLAADIGWWQLQGFGVWVVERRGDGAQLGVCGFWQGRGWPRELTWWLLPEARGQGFAQEASRAAIAQAYAGFGWPAVETYMADNNDAARALVLRLGASKVERRIFPDGQERDLFRFPRP
jgi:RimJ/RimL family protein N-acetyltransferase